MQQLDLSPMYGVRVSYVQQGKSLAGFLGDIFGLMEWRSTIEVRCNGCGTNLAEQYYLLSVTRGDRVPLCVDSHGY